MGHPPDCECRACRPVDFFSEDSQAELAEMGYKVVDSCCLCGCDAVPFLKMLRRRLFSMGESHRLPLSSSELEELDDLLTRFQDVLPWDEQKGED